MGEVRAFRLAPRPTVQQGWPMRLIRYIIRRILLLVPVLLAATFIAFALTRILPGNPIDRVLPPYISAERRAEIKHEARLDLPFYTQFYFYLLDLAHGNMGVSYTTAQTVSADLTQRFPATFELVTVAMLLAIGAGVPIGVLSAINKDRWMDHTGRIVSVLGVSLPIFWLALILLYTFFYQLRWAPPPLGRIGPLLSAPRTITGLFTVDAALTGNWVVFNSAAASLVLPAFTLGFTAMAPIARMTRSSMIEALQSEYVRTAICMGLPKRVIFLQHAFKNALLPIITITAAVYGYVLGGEVLVEYVFSWPGMGLYAFNAILASDFPAIQGFILLVTAIYVGIYLALDLVTVALDPRVEF
jgi:peptide/nickel transport system permease protein